MKNMLPLTLSLSLLKFVDSAISMTSSLRNLVDNLVEGIQNIKYKDFNYFLNMKL